MRTAFRFPPANSITKTDNVPPPSCFYTRRLSAPDPLTLPPAHPRTQGAPRRPRGHRRQRARGPERPGIRAGLDAFPQLQVEPQPRGQVGRPFRRRREERAQEAVRLEEELPGRHVPQARAPRPRVSARERRVRVPRVSEREVDVWTRVLLGPGLRPVCCTIKTKFLFGFLSTTNADDAFAISLSAARCHARTR